MRGYRGYRRYRGYMRREKRSHRKERTFHRWLAVFMTAVLIISESNLTVLAEEGMFYAEAQEGEVSDEVSSEETEDVDVDDTDGTDNVDDTDGADNADDTDDTGDEDELPNEDIENSVVTEAVEGDGIEVYVIGDRFSDSDGLKYKIISDDQVEVTGHEMKEAFSGELVIPETADYGGYPYRVTSIGANAFSGYTDLSNVVIPDSITNIGERAFYRCVSLSSIEIPDSVTNIENEAFRQCFGLSSMKIPNGITAIANEVFANCTGLVSIEIPDSVTSIGSGAFSDCIVLSNIKIPDGVTHIGSSAFHNCAGLSNIKIPDGITRIRWSVFEGCTGLSSIEIPDGVTDIGAFAFSNCTGLGSIKIPDGVTIIEHDAFVGCTSLSNIKIPNSVTSMDIEAFAACYDLISVEMPNNITIGMSAFLNCSKLCTMRIVVSSYETITPPTVWDWAFDGTPADRSIVFLAEDGTELTGDALKAAQDAFKADNRDGNDSDGLWWGWKFGGTQEDYSITYYLDGYTASEADSKYTYGIEHKLPMPVRDGYVFDGWYENENYSGDKIDSIGSTETGNKIYYGQWIEQNAPSYSVKVTVKKDDGDWEKHERVFMLLKEDGSLTANFEEVNKGKYFVYDVTGVADEDLSQKGVNTGVPVLVEDKDVDVTVNYYTVTFYDGSIAYEADTAQAPQIILKGKKAVRPANPFKTGYQFQQWVTTDKGSETFNFDVPIAEKSYVYADWAQETATKYIIEALAGEGGSIFPSGNVSVQEGGSQIFEMTPDEGYRIKAVIVDGVDRTEEITDSARARAVRAQAAASRYYTFSDVRENHTIAVLFETESSGDSGNTGTGGNGGDDSGTSTGGNDGGSTGDNSDNTDGSHFIDISNTGDISNADAAIENSNRNIDISVESTVNKNSADNSVGNPSKDTEPKTGDSSQVEIYATVAMIAGLTYLLLYFADKEKGMTEEKKEELVASMIGWAKRGRRIRKYVVLVPIFILLCYYHSIGKRIEVDWEEEPVWAEL